MADENDPQSITGNEGLYDNAPEEGSDDDNGNNTALGGDEETEGQPDNNAGADDDSSDGDDDQSDGSDNGEGDESGDESDSEPKPFDPEQLNVPEGFELDQELMQEFQPIAEELELDHNKAQQLMDTHFQALQKFQDQIVDQHQQQVQQWAEEAAKDSEFGGDNYQASLQTAKQALDKFGTPELREVLNQTGMGNNPELIRFCVRAGQAMSEDTFDRDGQGAAQESRSPEQILFDKTPQ